MILDLMRNPVFEAEHENVLYSKQRALSIFHPLLLTLQFKLVVRTGRFQQELSNCIVVHE